MAGEDRSIRRVELVSTILLAVATVATAWAGYQASRWNGEQSKTAARANATRFEANRSASLATGQTQVDVATFIQWVDAYAHDNQKLTDFYMARFRAEFKPAVEAWLATEPLKNPDAPLTPFAMPEYRLAATADAERLDTTANELAAKARVDVDRATRYVLCVVLFAASLFFAGMSTRMRTPAAETAVLAIGCVIFLGTLVWMATFPISVSL